jgi:hypothetical protein
MDFDAFDRRASKTESSVLNGKSDRNKLIMRATVRLGPSGERASVEKSGFMRVFAPIDNMRKGIATACSGPFLLWAVRISSSLACASIILLASPTCALAQQSEWELKPIEELLPSSQYPLTKYAAAQEKQINGGTFSLWNTPGNGAQIIDHAVAPAELAEPAIEEEMPRPSFLNSAEPQLSITEELSRLKQRVNELETSKTANEDAVRTIIGQSFAARSSNITDAVTFGGTLETLTFWQEDFNGVAESDIKLDTFELDFEVHMNTWSRASLVLEYFDGSDFLFPTNEGDEVGVDRLTVRRGFITIGDTTRFPLFVTSGRDVIPFGISTGDPVTDVLTITDPLTVEVFETKEDFLLFGFEAPVPPPPAPVSSGSPPAPAPPRPLLFNPLGRMIATSLCPYCGPPPLPTKKYTWPPAQCVAPYSGAIYFYNGDTTPHIDAENHIQQMGGTLGYRAKGIYPISPVPWSLQANVDVNSSVFDSNFLQHEYRHFLDQIGFVPGMAAHVRTSMGPVGLVLEWNGAIHSADFTDDAGNPVSITPQAWQVAINYQFDWNPSVENIGAQGTYLAVGYSQSSDLAGVTRIVDPLNPVALRTGNVPERRFSIGIGEWILDGMRIAIEYSRVFDYSTDEGGTGNGANAYLMQWTYEF